MLGMAMNSAKLFFAGKLFKDNKTVMRQMLMGAILGIVAGVVVGMLPQFGSEQLLPVP